MPSSLSPLSRRLFTREDARVMRKIKAETHKNNKDKWKRRGTVSHHSILSRCVLKSKRLKPSTKTHHYIQSGWDPRGSLLLSLSPTSPIFSVVLFLLFSVSRPLSSCFPWYPRCLLSSSPAHPPSFFFFLSQSLFLSRGDPVAYRRKKRQISQ